MSQNVIDRCNREDGPIGSADSGQAWVTPGTPQWTVLGNKLARTGGVEGWNGAEAWIDTGSADSLIEATCGDNLTYVSFVQRCSVTPGAHFMILPTPNFLYLYWTASGYNYAIIATYALPIAPGDRLGSLMIGTRWEIFLNGVSKIVYNLDPNAAWSALLGNTRHGISSYYAGATLTWDNVSIKVPVRIHDGTAMKNRMVRVWDGAAHVRRAARRWNGTYWR